MKALSVRQPWAGLIETTVAIFGCRGRSDAAMNSLHFATPAIVMSKSWGQQRKRIRTMNDQTEQTNTNEVRGVRQALAYLTRLRLRITLRILAHLHGTRP